MNDTHTKDIIYTKARRMFSERGYFATTVRDIADEVGIKGASIYAHVTGKEELLWELVLNAAQTFRDRVFPILNSDASPERKLRDAIIEHVTVIAENIESATIYFHEWKFLSPQRRRAVRDRRDAYERAFRDVLQEGIDRGVFTGLPAHHASLLLLSSLNGIYTWYRPSGKLKPRELGEKYADLFIHGLQ